MGYACSNKHIPSSLSQHVFLISVKMGYACSNKHIPSSLSHPGLAPPLCEQYHGCSSLKRLRHSFLQLSWPCPPSLRTISWLFFSKTASPLLPTALQTLVSLFGEAAMSDNITTNIIIPWGSLPDELLTNIFVFLPVKSIIICASVSKAWKSLIKNSTFISTHLHHSLNKNQNLLFFGPCLENQKEFYALYNEDDADFTQHARFDYPFHAPPHNGKYSVVGTCNGLLFLSKVFRGDNSLCLWNPCVGKLLKLPSPNITNATHGSIRAALGFGFDPKSKDYKVIRVVTLLESLDLEKSRPLVEIYTLSTGQWRMLRTGLAPICTLYGIGPQTFINGALHWVAFFSASDKNIHNFFLVFDLGEEVFHEILLPEFPGHMGLMFCSVSVYRNSIAFFRMDNEFLHIWAMKEYGVVSSWTKVFSLPLFNLDFFGASDSIQRALGFRRNGEVILKLDGGRLISLDLETREIKDLRIMGYEKTIVDYYVESLLLLDKAANSEDTY